MRAVPDWKRSILSNKCDMRTKDNQIKMIICPDNKFDGLPWIDSSKISIKYHKDGSFTVIEYYPTSFSSSSSSERREGEGDERKKVFRMIRYFEGQIHSSDDKPAYKEYSEFGQLIYTAWYFKGLLHRLPPMPAQLGVDGSEYPAEIVYGSDTNIYGGITEIYSYPLWGRYYHMGVLVNN